MWDIIPESVKELHTLFNNNNKKLYVVGGAVRDFITGDNPKDFDLATDALPEEVLEILKGSYNTNLQGEAFGVVVVYTEDEPLGMEIATFRTDISKGRNPEVKLGVTIEDDVKRRDLTFNALFYDLEQRKIIDLVGGVEDLERSITKTVGNPIERFDEDSLRILRAFRFNSRYNFTLDESIKEAVEVRNELENIDPDTGVMKRISQERIWEEMKKSFAQVKNYNTYLNLFTEFNMWGEVFPNSNINTQLIPSTTFEVIIANLFKKEDFSDRKIIENKLVQQYKLESDLASTVIFLNTLLDFNSDFVFDIYKKRKQLRISDDILLEWLSVNNIKDKMLFKFIDYTPSVLSQELMEEGFSGKELGLEIKRRESEAFNNF